MLLLTGISELLALCAGTAIQSELGVVGLVLLFLLSVALRARHHRMAAWAAAVLLLLLTAKA
ncbi:hypothetical protein ACF05L_17105 [Streptomyces bobili]|uniref:hypothetical protein n=1 Tax=Streptomyces bobili TaxID=67280 RepID=UPI0037006C96